MLLRSENVLSRSRGQPVAELEQKGDILTPSSLALSSRPRLLLYLYKRYTKDFPSPPSSLAAFSLLKKNKTLPTQKD